MTMTRTRHPIRRLLRFRPKEAASTASTVTTVGSQDDWDDAFADVRNILDRKTNCISPRHTHSVPWLIAYTCYLAYAILLILGQIRDSLSRIFRRGRYYTPTSERYAPLLNNWEKTYTRRIYHRIQDCFNRPVVSNPGTRLLVMERASRDGKKSFEVLRKEELGETELTHYSDNPYSRGVQGGNASKSCILARDCLNLGSYNYLGFAASGQLKIAAPNASDSLAPKIVVYGPRDATSAEMQTLAGLKLAGKKAGVEVEVHSFKAGIRPRPVAFTPAKRSGA